MIIFHTILKETENHFFDCVTEKEYAKSCTYIFSSLFFFLFVSRVFPVWVKNSVSCSLSYTLSYSRKEILSFLPSLPTFYPVTFHTRGPPIYRVYIYYIYSISSIYIVLYTTIYTPLISSASLHGAIKNVS